MSELIQTNIVIGEYGNIAEITLNNPKALNSLNIEMIDAMQVILDQCEKDDSIQCVFIQGAGEKAFCAGGDVVSLYHSMQETQEGEVPKLASEFFTKEYKLDYRLHTFSKPVITWGHGIVMGGGIGVMSAGSHRVVTERSMLAMPEVTIGLYPDVGASWFFNRMPGKLGMFLGITGARMNSSDAIFTKLADYFLLNESKEQLLDNLTQVEWSNPYKDVDDEIKRIENTLVDQEPESNLVQHFDEINWLMDFYSIEDTTAHLKYDESESDWMNKSLIGFKSGSAVTYKLVEQQIKRAKYLSLKQVFQMELTVSTRCAMNKDLPEGIRALLIDKDGKPAWSINTLDELTETDVEEFFTSPWESEHPLSCL
jgi:enoyl-CoA hydratase/carnithine racemase